MPTYNPPLRDMQFVMHEVLNVIDDLKQIPQHAEMDVDTINAVLEEGGKFATEVIFPLNISGDQEGCKIDQTTHAVTTPTGFKEAYAKYIESGWAALGCDTEFGGQGLPLVVNQLFYEMLNSANQRIGSPNAVLVPRPGKPSCAPEPELARAKDILPPTVADLQGK